MSVLFPKTKFYAWWYCIMLTTLRTQQNLGNLYILLTWTIELKTGNNGMSAFKIYGPLLVSFKLRELCSALSLSDPPFPFPHHQHHKIFRFPHVFKLDCASTKHILFATYHCFGPTLENQA